MTLAVFQLQQPDGDAAVAGPAEVTVTGDRVAELMCLPIHHDVESARRALPQVGALEPDLWP